MKAYAADGPETLRTIRANALPEAKLEGCDCVGHGVDDHPSNGPVEAEHGTALSTSQNTREQVESSTTVRFYAANGRRHYVGEELRVHLEELRGPQSRIMKWLREVFSKAPEAAPRLWAVKEIGASNAGEEPSEAASEWIQVL